MIVMFEPPSTQKVLPSERAALKQHKVILTERDDTATVERKIGGIKGKPRSYAIDVRALHRLASE
jgi:hypothetical protein